MSMILVVEDSEDISGFIKNKLHEVFDKDKIHHAPNYVVADALLSEGNYSVVIVDDAFPNEDADEAWSNGTHKPSLDDYRGIKIAEKAKEKNPKTFVIGIPNDENKLKAHVDILLPKADFKKLIDSINKMVIRGLFAEKLLIVADDDDLLSAKTRILIKRVIGDFFIRTDDAGTLSKALELIPNRYDFAIIGSGFSTGFPENIKNVIGSIVDPKRESGNALASLIKSNTCVIGFYDNTDPFNPDNVCKSMRRPQDSASLHNLEIFVLEHFKSKIRDL